MATLTVTATIPAAHTPDTVYRLLVGTENAASLAASTPAGGTRLIDLTLGELADGSGTSAIVLEATYTPDGRCATLPVGVAAIDAAGNVSSVVETTVNLADPPRGVNDLAISATDPGSPAIDGAADLTWSVSPDVAVPAGGVAAGGAGIDLLDFFSPPFDLVADLVQGEPGYAIFERPTTALPSGGDVLVAFLPPGTTTYRYQGGAANSQRYVYVRAYGCSGVADTEPVTRKLRRVAFDADGALIAPAPNVPQNVTATPTAAGRLRVTFGYSPAGQEVAADVFRVFAVESPASIDPDGTPASSPKYATN